MKKLKTLIVIDNLHTGGVATSLYNFIHFAQSRLDIYLLSFNEESIDKSKLPNGVNIVKSSKILHILGKNHSEIKQESFIMMFYRLVMIFFARVFNGVLSRNFLWPLVSKEGEYDLAIAYAQDDSWKSISKGCIDFIIKKVNAKHKSVVVHCDYKNFGGYNAEQVKMLSQLDNILCVSDSCKRSFVECFPSLESKTRVCENFTKVDEIRSLAGSGTEYPPHTTNYVSVCRLSKVKGLQRTIKAFGQIQKEGLENFTWTIVGDGPDMEELKNMIQEENLSSRVKLLGNKNNPYVYIKNSSCLLLSSLHEAAPMVFNEAVCLGVPILSTETCSAMELVRDRGYGLVVPNSYDGILNGIRSFLSSPVSINTAHMSETAINQNAIEQLNNFVNSLEVC